MITINGHTSYVLNVAFSPDGTKVASASKDLSVKIWNVLSGELIHTLLGHKSFIRSVAFSPNG